LPILRHAPRALRNLVFPLERTNEGCLRSIACLLGDAAEGALVAVLT